MARRVDPFIKVYWQADQLLKELEIDALPIDPFEIARRLDIELRPLPASAGGASGMPLHVGGEFGICYPSSSIKFQTEIPPPRISEICFQA